ncbi:MAG: acyl-CoA thioesterase [Firmicutes bacterium]|nr:acyl-CoA thioesterase [Bacillota bacterium]
MNTFNLKHLLLENYPIKTYDKIRYPDTDRQGHVNNSVFSTYFETGRIEFLYHPNNGFLDDSTYVIARLELDFIDEIKWPGNIDIGTAVIHIGNSSMRLAQGLYQDGRLVATAESVIVQVDQQHKKSKALTDKQKESLSHLTLK